MIGRRAVLLGLVAVIPTPALAQSATPLPRIAIAHSSFPVSVMTETGHPRFVGFFAELRRQGYVEGENIIVERWSAEGGSSARVIVALAQQIVDSAPDVIVSLGLPLTEAFPRATSTIPIVFSTNIPPDFPFVASFARPGGNITGFTMGSALQIYGKQLQLLTLVAPGAPVGWIGPRDFWEANSIAEATRTAARDLGVALVPILIESPTGEPTIRAAFGEVPGSGVGALFVSSEPSMQAYPALLGELVAGAGLPSVSQFGEYTHAGLLMSYGPNYPDVYARQAHYVALVLEGANTAEMPIQQPTAFDFVVNLGAAAALGLTLPPEIMTLATEIVE